MPRQSGPGFTSYLIAIFIPPLYFIMRGRWGAALVNGFFYLLSFPLLFLFGIGTFTFLICAVHAVFDFRTERKAGEIVATADLVAAHVARQQAVAQESQQQNRA